MRSCSSAFDTTDTAMSRSGLQRAGVGDRLEHALVHPADEHDDGVGPAADLVAVGRLRAARVDPVVVPVDRPEARSTIIGITTAGIHAPAVNFDTTTTISTMPVATQPTALMTRPRCHFGSRSVRWCRHHAELATA